MYGRQVTGDPPASPDTVPTCVNLGATPPGTEPGTYNPPTTPEKDFEIREIVTTWKYALLSPYLLYGSERATPLRSKTKRAPDNSTDPRRGIRLDAGSPPPPQSHGNCRWNHICGGDALSVSPERGRNVAAGKPLQYFSPYRPSAATGTYLPTYPGDEMRARFARPAGNPIHAKQSEPSRRNIAVYVAKGMAWGGARIRHSIPTESEAVLYARGQAARCLQPRVRGRVPFHPSDGHSDPHVVAAQRHSSSPSTLTHSSLHSSDSAPVLPSHHELAISRRRPSLTTADFASALRQIASTKDSPTVQLWLVFIGS
ncbi:hypothetical protein PR048_028632 [Dryococelus australis]|uniref:Uncharacterized protein n=1 Tax=Dryococelus australis TaxID=614101 RepID=A0ABQ9GEW1_9NEOP|nr:hypothetical protein PR048_028632 [Dryococelus australis]